MADSLIPTCAARSFTQSSPLPSASRIRILVGSPSTRKVVGDRFDVGGQHY